MSHFRQPSQMLLTEVVLPFNIRVDAIEDVAYSKKIDHFPVCKQFGFKAFRNGFLARVPFSSNEYECRLLPVFLLPLVLGNHTLFPLDVSHQDLVSHPALGIFKILANNPSSTDLVTVHDHKSACDRHILSQIESLCPLEFENAFSDVMAIDRLFPVEQTEVRGVHDPMDLLQSHRNFSGPYFQGILLVLDHRIFPQPEEANAKPGRYFGSRFPRFCNDFPPRDIDLFVEGDARGIARRRFQWERFVKGLDTSDSTLLA